MNPIRFADRLQEVGARARFSFSAASNSRVGPDVKRFLRGALASAALVVSSGFVFSSALVVSSGLIAVGAFGCAEERPEAAAANSAAVAQQAQANAAFQCPDTCDDANACTLTKCRPDGTCLPSVTKKVGAACDDGLTCTVMDFCDAAGKCDGTLAPKCVDGDPCTSDLCDHATGACAHKATPNAASCTLETNCQPDKACKGKDCFGPLHAPKPPCRSFTSPTAKSVPSGAPTSDDHKK